MTRVFNRIHASVPAIQVSPHSFTRNRSERAHPACAEVRVFPLSCKKNSGFIKNKIFSNHGPRAHGRLQGGGMVLSRGAGRGSLPLPFLLFPLLLLLVGLFVLGYWSIVCDISVGSEEGRRSPGRGQEESQRPHHKGAARTPSTNTTPQG